MRNNYIIVLILTLILSACNMNATNHIKLEEIPTAGTENKYSELFNVELVGLTKDKKRFYVDFASACYCNSPSILMTEKKVYLFGYCKDALPPLSKDPFYTYSIIETIQKDNSLYLSLKNEKNEHLGLTFIVSKNVFIYELSISGDFPTDYIGSSVSSFFTFLPNKFEVEDCGDFDG